MSLRPFSINIKSGGKALVNADHYDVFQDEITFLFGESGIGKSLLAKAVYGLLDGGGLDVEVNGRPYEEHVKDRWVKAVQESSFFVFQEPSSHLNPLMKISEQMSEGSLKSLKDDTEVLCRLWDTEDVAAVSRVVSVYPKPYRPSGGEKQRSLLAMAFKKIRILLEQGDKNASTFFVFDEPTGSLDNHYRNIFLKLLFEEYAKRPFTLLIVTHDYSIISEIVKNYKPLAPKVHFRELSRKGETETVLRDFSPGDYLGWLSKMKPEREAARKDVVLQFGSAFEVFGRSLRVFRDEARRTPADLEVRRGETVYLKAQSGVGKTTLAKIIMGLYPAEAFSMTLCGITLSGKSARRLWSDRLWGKKAGMVFQHADEALNLQATVFETFSGLPLKSPLTRESLKVKLGELFEGEITEAFLDKKVVFLSGGQKQRLNLLRTLAVDTDLIILDEPLNGLDFLSIKKVLSLLEEKRRAGKAMLMISHNEEIFDAMVDKENVYYLGELDP
jgi:peptide/nickel transport system ATP-binding protein